MHSPLKISRINITSKIKANIITGVAAVLLAVVSLAAILVWTGVIERQPSTAPGTPSAPDTPTSEWLEIASWESSGGGDSLPFPVSADTWRVMWTASHDSVGDGRFALQVYNPDGLFLLELYDTANNPDRNFDGPLRGTLGVPGPGDFFIRTITTRDYNLTVQELR